LIGNIAKNETSIECIMSSAKPIQEAARISYQNVRIHWIAVTLIQYKVEPKQRNVHITTLQELHQFYH